MQAVILAGGKGTRLRPLTYDIPKVMAPVGEKPFLEYVINLLKKNGIKEIILCVGHLGKKVEEYFGNGEKWEIDIKYSYEKENLMGTGGALKIAEDLIKDDFLLLFGDTFLDIDYQDLISYFHKKNKMGVVVVLKTLERLLINNILVDDRNEVIKYDKNAGEGANCVDAGVLIFKKDIFDFIKKNEIVSLEEEIYPILIKNNEFSAYTTSTKFYDIGTFERLDIFKQVI